MRFSASRCSSSRAPVDDAACASTCERRGRSATGPSSAAASMSDLRRRRSAAAAPGGWRRRERAAAGRRPGGACAARAQRRARPPRRARRRATSASSSRLARTLVSGVRSSWRGVGDELALAGEGRLGLLARASSSAWSMPSSVRASSAISSSVSGTGTRMFGSRVSSMRRAVAVSARDRGHRATRDPQAGGEGQRGSAQHAQREEDPHAGHGALDVGHRAGVLDRERDREARLAPVGVRSRSGAPGSRRGSRRSARCGPGAARSSGAPRVCSRICPLGSRTRIAALLGPP